MQRRIGFFEIALNGGNLNVHGVGDLTGGQPRGNQDSRLFLARRQFVPGILLRLGGRRERRVDKDGPCRKIGG